MVLQAILANDCLDNLQKTRDGSITGFGDFYISNYTIDIRTVRRYDDYPKELVAMKGLSQEILLRNLYRHGSESLPQEFNKTKVVNESNISDDIFGPWKDQRLC